MAELPNAFIRSGVTIRYADSPGAGPAVLFIHGAGADHVTFEAQASAVAECGRRVVLLDLRGQGQSRPNTAQLSAELFVEDVLALIETLGLVDSVLVGHSLGGNIAQALVRRNPDRFSGMVVLGSTWNYGPLTAAERFFLRLAAPGLGLLPARQLPELLAKSSAVTDEAKADAKRAFSQLSKREFLNVWRATVEFVAPEPSWRTPIPLLLIRGAKDGTGNIASAMPAWASAEGVAETVVPNAGHMVTQDAPTATTNAILDFLQLP